MTYDLYIYAFVAALIIGGLNSIYWKNKGYNQGGRLFFLGTIAFFGIIMVILKLFY